MSRVLRYIGLLILGLISYLPASFASEFPPIQNTQPLVLTANSTSSTPKKVYHSGFATKRPAIGTPVFIFSPKMHLWALYDSSGVLLKTGAASGGKSYCPDTGHACRTPVGTFHIVAKKGAGCKSSKFPVGKGGAPMPYCTFFTKNHAVHGSYEMHSYNASHGCIRVYPSAAQWIQQHLPYGSMVIVWPY